MSGTPSSDLQFPGGAVVDLRERGGFALADSESDGVEIDAGLGAHGDAGQEAVARTIIPSSLPVSERCGAVRRLPASTPQPWDRHNDAASAVEVTELVLSVALRL